MLTAIPFHSMSIQVGGQSMWKNLQPGLKSSQLEDMKKLAQTPPSYGYLDFHTIIKSCYSVGFWGWGWRE